MTKNKSMLMQTEIDKAISLFAQKAQEVDNVPCQQKKTSPILFFNSSTRISTVSQNAGFSLFAAWSLKLAGYPVIQVVCNNAINCLFNGKRDHDVCAKCINLSNKIFLGFDQEIIDPEEIELQNERISALQPLELEQLINFSIDEIKLGELVLPSVRWILRKYTLTNDEHTLTAYKQYLLSAWHLLEKFSEILDKHSPQAVVLFNGTFSPEVIFRKIAESKGIRVITHEVGLLPMTAYFTPGVATDYPMIIPEDYQLSLIQQQKIENYLEKRFAGQFSMAGVNFWPKMKPINWKIKRKLNSYSQCVTIFTNVIFDTSQTNANVLFNNMFDWLNQLVDIFKTNHETLFIIRAHPDETRPGKTSQEQVSDWIIKNKINKLKNVIFIDPNNYVSSYELINSSKFILIYNSTIGLEASILGKNVLCAAQSRFTPHDTVIFPSSTNEYFQVLNQLLTGEAHPQSDKAKNSKTFLFFQLFKYSLPLSEIFYPLQHYRGHVGTYDFDIKHLSYNESSIAKIIIDGIIQGKEFTLPDDYYENTN